MRAVVRAVVICFAGIALVACQENGTPNAGEEFSSTEVVATAKRDCERGGGSWGRRNEELFACFRPTADANEFCRAASDCEGLCLARSRTCAPTVPYFGCHEVLTASGLQATQCFE